MWEFTGQKRPHFAIPPGQGQESVWDYPRPPQLAPDPREIIVRLGERVIAKSVRSIRVLETASPPTFYIPPADLAMDLLRKVSGYSFCEWKGAASWWSLETEQGPIRHVGWSYENPSPAFTTIRDYLSFYPAKLECYVDGERVRPQAGGFYGGWITAEVIGPYKGAAGTGGW
jgi:uncharacterized protein (DUF427 family)